MAQVGRLSVILASVSILSWMVVFAESPESPKLVLHPLHPIYIQGEEVTLICSAPAQTNLIRCAFWEEIHQVLLWEFKASSRGFTLDGTSAGLFYCMCWIRKGEEILSPRSNFVSVARTESPLPPNLSLQPQHPIYILGEEVNLTCSAPARLYLAKYTFYRQSGDQFPVVRSQNPSNMFRLDGNAAGSYGCMYWTKVSGREIPSLRSNSISVTRTVHPQAPTLSLQPQHPIYIQGEIVTLICSAPPLTEVTGYTFWEEGGDRILQSQPKSPNNTFALDETSSKFYCTYWIQVSGREIESSLSKSVNVARTDPLQPPGLEIDPPSGAVNEGEPLLISCLTSGSKVEKRFHFYQDGVEIDSSNEGSSKSGDLSREATLWIPQANSSHGGEFACSFEEQKSRRWISSPWSQTSNVQVHAQGPSLPVLVSVCCALLVLILVVSLACYYCWRRRKASKGQEKFQPQRNQEETDNLGRLAPQPATLQPQCEVRLNQLSPVEDEVVSYSEIHFQPTHGLNSLNQAGGVTYSEIQTRPTNRAAK